MSFQARQQVCDGHHCTTANACIPWSFRWRERRGQQFVKSMYSASVHNPRKSCDPVQRQTHQAVRQSSAPALLLTHLCSRLAPSRLALVFGSVTCPAEGREIVDPIVTAFPP